MTYFSSELAIALTGASRNQLSSWRTTDLLRPEGGSRPKVRYSFRDLVALRTFVRMRSEVPLQRIRKALDSLHHMDLTEHPSQYVLSTDGQSVYLFHLDGSTVDLVKHPGQQLLINLGDAFDPFVNLQGRQVVNFRQPREHIQVREQRLGGWPTIVGTRLPFDEIARQVGRNLEDFDEVHSYYPSLTRASAIDAVSFEREIEGFRFTQAVSA